MKSVVYVLFMAVVGSALALSQSASAAKTAKTAKKPGATTKKTKTSASRKTVVRRVAAAPRQAVPTPDRYREIQQALAAKGYLKSEPSGVWDADSIDAMKRFQADQKQEPTGKLTAASLIDLGLGPHREPAPAAVVISPTPQP